MSTSTDAILGFGYAMTNEWEIDGELLEQARKKFPDLEFGEHCYIDSPMLYVSIKQHHYRASRGEVIEPEETQINEEALEHYRALLISGIAHLAAQMRDDDDDVGADMIMELIGADPRWFLVAWYDGH